MKKLEFLEALRGYAILGVLFTHVTQKMVDLPNWLNNFGIQGARGVQLFFIVSAFTLFFSYTRKYGSNPIELKDYFIRRFFRIAPMFYFAFLFYMSFDLSTYFVGVKDFVNNYSFDMIFSTLTFTSLIHPDWLYSLVPGGWSISAEMIFYLFVPILFLYVKSIKRSIVLVVLTLGLGWLLNVILVEYNLISEQHISENYLFYWFPSQLPVFALGIMFFNVWNKDMQISRSTSNILIFISLILIFILGVTGNYYNPYFPKHFLFGLAFILLAFGLGNVDKHILLNKPILFIGKISFSMYLVHFFVLDVVEELFLDVMLNYMSSVSAMLNLFIVTLGISTPLSYLTFKFIETPGIKLGRKISKNIQNKKDEPATLAK